MLAFGPSYSYALIRILYGQKWSDGEAPLALRYYCFYVISLAMNGLFYSISTVLVFIITNIEFYLVPLKYLNIYFFLFFVYTSQGDSFYKCVFIGTTEAFLHAVANETQLKRSNNWLLIFSAIYIILNVLLIRSAGAVGLITANSISIFFLTSHLVTSL